MPGYDWTKPKPENVHFGERQLSVLRMIAKGYNQLEMAEELELSINTIKGHCGSIYAKLGMPTDCPYSKPLLRQFTTIWAIRNGVC